VHAPGTSRCAWHRAVKTSLDERVFTNQFFNNLLHFGTTSKPLNLIILTNCHVHYTKS